MCSSDLSLIKRGSGTLKLVGHNAYSGATTVTNGRIQVVTGGSSSNSAVVVNSSGTANAFAKLGVLCTVTGGVWRCASLTTMLTSPATTNPALEFTFGVMPSALTNAAPLQVFGAVTFTAVPSVTVYLNGLGAVPEGAYPLMTVGGAAPAAVPPLTMVGGYAGSTLSWSADGKTLFLNLTGSPASPLTWGSGAAGLGLWDVNNDANAVWKDSAATSASYHETIGSGLVGDSVMFDDTYISADTVVTLNSFVAPASVSFTNVNYAYTLTGVGGITGNVSVVKAGSNMLTQIGRAHV